MLTNPATGKDRHGVAALVRDVLLCETNKPKINKLKNYLRSRASGWSVSSKSQQP